MVQSLLLIRHGFSCSNAQHHLSRKHNKEIEILSKENPTLTDVGIDQCKTVEHYIPPSFWQQFDFFGVSILLRTFETAHLIFPLSIRTLHVLPYCHEMSSKMPYDRDSYTVNYYGARKWNKYDLVLSSSLKKSHLLPYSKQRQFNTNLLTDDFYASSTGKFLNFLHMMFPSNANVAVVSHANYMVRMAEKRFGVNPSTFYTSQPIFGRAVENHPIGNFFNTEMIWHDFNQHKTVLLYSNSHIHRSNTAKQSTKHLKYELVPMDYARCLAVQ
jgi:hypothetical protein